MSQTLQETLHLRCNIIKVLSIIFLNSLKAIYMLRRELSLKVICEKVKFSICEFCNNFRDYEWTYI